MSAFSLQLASLFLLLLLSSSAVSSENTVTVVVDSNTGDNDQCMSAIDMVEMGMDSYPVPCATLNYAVRGNLSLPDDLTVRNCTLDDTSILSNVRIVLRSGLYVLSEQVFLGGSKNITFQADSDSYPVVSCAANASALASTDNCSTLFMCGVEGLVFNGITFTGFGSTTSTAPVIYIHNSTSVVVESCEFNENFVSSIEVNSTRYLRISDSVFTNNTNRFMTDSGNIRTSGNYSQSNGGLLLYLDGEYTTFEIENCSFSDNTAVMNNESDNAPLLLQQGGHGGAILIQANSTVNSTVRISNSRFIRNHAQVDGGAVYISYMNNSVNNTFWLSNVYFEYNSAMEASGGAVSVNSFNHTYGNSFIIEECNFMGNTARAGAGFSMALYDSDHRSNEHPDNITFIQCQFTDNKATNEGTAVGLFSLVHVDQVGFPVYFNSCVFQNNTSIAGKDTSAVAAFRFPIVFEDYNRFLSNIGGGIMLLNTRMVVSGEMLFADNTATFGGGITMDDRCLLEVGPHVNMTFIGNYASESGGAIYVEFPPIRFVIDIFNRLCFLQYKDDTRRDIAPQDWNNVSINFIENSARLSGAAIYANDMQRCSWLGNNLHNITGPTLIFKPPEQILDNSNITYPFLFKDNTLEINNNSVKDQDLATAPLKILPYVQHTSVQPGERIAITLIATDQLDNTREAIWALDVSDQETILDALSANSDTYFYTIPLPTNKSSNSCSPYHLHLNFSLLKTLGLSSSLDLTVYPCCHPGYKNYPNGSCLCNTQDHPNILRCDDSNRYFYLREGIFGSWSYTNDSNVTLTTPRVLPGYTDCTHQGRLPGCLFKFDVPDDQCVKGRTGYLCGNCSENYFVTLDLQSCTNKSCSNGIAVFILLSCFGVFLICFVILWFNIPIPNELKGFIFYVQVIGLVYRPYSVITNQAGGIRAISIIVNLLGFSNPVPLCISHWLKTRHVALLGYIPPFIIFFSILLFAIGARFNQKLADHSALKGITTLSVFFYKYIADTSFVFLSCVKTDLGFVFQYDGTVSCSSPYFGFFFALALLIVIFFVIPLPFLTSYVCIRRPRHFQAYADVLTDGLHTRHHWWGGWDIFRRLPFVMISFFVVLSRPSLILFFMSIAALVVMIVHILTKPYQNMYTNIIEAAILLNLLLVTGAFLDPSSEQVPETFAYILMFLPYLFCIGYIIWSIVKYIRRRFLPRRPQTDTDASTAGNNQSITEKFTSSFAVVVGLIQPSVDTIVGDNAGSGPNTNESQVSDTTTQYDDTNTTNDSTTTPSSRAVFLREPLLDDD